MEKNHYDHSCTIITSNCQFHTNTVYQFSLDSKDKIPDLWEAIAESIRNNCEDKI